MMTSDNTLKSRLLRWARTIGRFGLLGILVLMTFGFLASGLSSPDSQAVAGRESAQPSEVPVSNTATSTLNLDSEAISQEASVSPSVDSTPQLMQRRELAALIQQQWQDHISEQEVDSASPADWLTVCRRLSLGLVGTGVSLEEIRLLEQIPESQRVPRHRENLLNSGRFHDYWSERYTRFLVGADEGPFLLYRRRRFRTWLSDQFQANLPYDQLVRQLITAEGLWTDQPEVNFFTVTFDSGDGSPDPVRMAARVSRAFLGIRIDCLQCHNDFLGNVSMGDPIWMNGNDEFREGTQQDFHSLAAFFTAAKAKGLLGLRDGDAEYEYQYLDAEETVPVEPGVPYRRDLLPEVTEGDASVDQRQRLADWMTHPENKQFALAGVARVWTLLMGKAPASSVDDLPLDQSAHPILNTLTDNFIASGYDVRELIRTITDSPAFRVDSRADFEITQRHENAMAVFPVVRLRGEQVAGSAIQAARIKTVDRESSIVTQLQMFGGRNDFLKRYGDLGEDEFRVDSVTITQRLVMLNGELTREYSDWNPVLNTTAHVGMFANDDPSVVDSIYLATLNRHPTDLEKEHFVGRFVEAKDRQQAIVDLMWVLFNSSEFAWNH